jgi:hypothetical protein
MALILRYIMSNQANTNGTTTPVVYHGLSIAVVEQLMGRFLSSSSVIFEYCGWKVIDGVATPSKCKYPVGMVFNHSVSDDGVDEWWGITEGMDLVRLRLPYPRTGVRHYAFVKTPPTAVKFVENHRIRWLIGEGAQNLLTPVRGDHVSGHITPLMEQFFVIRGVIVDRS